MLYRKHSFMFKFKKFIKIDPKIYLGGLLISITQIDMKDEYSNAKMLINCIFEQIITSKYKKDLVE